MKRTVSPKKIDIDEIFKGIEAGTIFSVEDVLGSEVALPPKHKPQTTTVLLPIQEQRRTKIPKVKQQVKEWLLAGRSRAYIEDVLTNNYLALNRSPDWITWRVNQILCEIAEER